MRDIDELIKYHNECEYLDFKREEYKKETIHNLVKDVLSFANANTEGSRFIIIGVYKKDGQITLNNIGSKYDSANIQQKIHASITPEIHIDYFPYQFEDCNLMVLEIKDPTEQPYLVTKDVSIKRKDGQTELFLRANDCWIRKGSYQVLANRDDLSRMFSRPTESESFDKYLKVYFPQTCTNTNSLEVIKNIDFPSEQNRREIEMVIKKKREQVYYKDSLPLSFSPIWPFQGTTYEQRDLETLEEDLKNVKETYKEDDLFYFYEEISHKLNFSILNVHDRYLEDASVELRIQKTPGLHIAPEVHYIEEESNFPIYNPRVPSFNELNYPQIGVIGEYFLISEHIGNLKHHIEQNMFKVDLRVVITIDINVSEFQLLFTIFAKNIKEPIERVLNVAVIR